MRLGIIGGGQLGRMLAMAGMPFGIRTTVLDPADDPCAGQVCQHIQGEFDDLQKLYQLVQQSDVVTFEFENVPVDSARWLAERVPLFPPSKALEVSQDRIVEKSFFQSLGIPTPPFAAIQTREEFDQAIRQIGLPAVLKTRRFGYDGKGQTVIRTTADVEPAWKLLGGRPLILEGFVPFDRELSLIAVRGRNGEFASYPLVENVHREGMLHTTTAPARNVGEELNERAADFAERILTELNYVGILAIEWFQDGPRLLANEMAPRVHNSGHYSIEGAVTSQFENHIRAIFGMPLGSTAIPRPTGMLNLIGMQPDFAKVLGMANAKLHWYGKEPKLRRKVGHITVTAATDEERDAMIKSFEEGIA